MTRFILVLFLSFGFSAHAQKKDSFKFCNFGPEVRVIKPSGTPKKGCAARVKVQSIMWKCCEGEDVNEYTHEFFKKVKKSARQACERYCESRGSGCKTRFSAPLKCGFDVKRQFSETVGKKFKCSSRCEGKHIAYCSVYHSGYMKTTASQLSGKAPNCICSN